MRVLGGFEIYPSYFWHYSKRPKFRYPPITYRRKSEVGIQPEVSNPCPPTNKTREHTAKRTPPPSLEKEFGTVL